MGLRRAAASAGMRFMSVPTSVKIIALCAVGAAAYGAYVGLSRLGCRVEDLGEMGEHLRSCGTVVVVGGDDLPGFEGLEGCTLEPVDEHPEVEKALRGRDEAALVAALRRAGADKVLVAVDTTDPQLMPAPTLRHLLGTYRSFDRFHAVYLSQAAGLFEIAEPFDLNERAGAELVAIARAMLTGAEPPPAASLSDPVTRSREGAEVALLIQGLQPVRVDRSSVNYTRRDYFLSRTGSTLRDATIGAARRLREQWDSTGNLEREGELDEAMAQLTIEVEVIHDRTPIALLRNTLDASTYRQYLWNAIELGVHGIEGQVGSTRRFLLPSAAVYWSRADVHTYLQRLSRKFDLDHDGREGDSDQDLYPTAAELRVQRFRTIHFREMTPGGQVRRLDRGFVPVRQADVTRESLREGIRQAAGWLAAHIQDDGLFEYKYYPTRDVFYREFHEDDEEAHNIVRHGLACYSLFMVARELDDEALWDAAMRSLEPMIDSTVIGPTWYSDPGRRRRLPEDRRVSCSAASACDLPEECIEGTCRLPFGAPVRDEGGDRQLVAPGDSWESHDGHRRSLDPTMMYVRWMDVGKMGAVAAVVMALTELVAERPELLDEYRPYLEGYWAFFRFMQKPDGSFNHYFTAPGDFRYYATETTIYPGEILFALSRLYRVLGDEAIRDSYDRGHRFYADWFRSEVDETSSDGTYTELRRNDLMAYVPWMTMASYDMYLQTPRREYAVAGVEASRWIAERFQWDEARTYYPAYMGSYYRVWWEQPAMHGLVYTEGTAAGFDLARRSGDRESAEVLRRSTLLGCRFGLQQIIRPGIDDHYLPGERARVRSRGGIRFSLTVADLRTDYTYHGLSAMVQTLRYFQDGDWEMGR
jgi:hypothetical protein